MPGGQICEVRRLWFTSDGASLAAPVPVGINSALLCLVAPLDEYIKRDKRLRASMCEATARAAGGRKAPPDPAPWPAGLHNHHFLFCFVFVPGKNDIHLFFSSEKSSGLSEPWMDPSIYPMCSRHVLCSVSWMHSCLLPICMQCVQIHRILAAN